MKSNNIRTLYNARNAQPVGTLATKELIQLEHKYRLLLKESGFQDIEAWDNRPLVKKKRVKFIKGHIRLRQGTWEDFAFKQYENKEFFRIIGLYAYHCKNLPQKYKIVLQDYSLTGNMVASINNTNSDLKVNSLGHYIKRNFIKMLEFVNVEFKDDE